MKLSRCAQRLAAAGLLASAFTVPPLAAQTATPAARPASAAASAATNPPVLASTTPVKGGLTLAQAYQAALEQDSVIRAARALADSKRERLPQSISQLLPNVSASAGRNKNHLFSTSPNPLTGAPFESEDRYTSSNRALTIRQPIFRPYQMADYQQAKAMVDDANAQLEKETQNVAVRVAGAFFEALLAQDQLALVAAQKASFVTQLNAAKRRFTAGSGVRTDIDEAQARLDMSVALEVEARQQVDYTRRQLQVMVNVPVTQLAPLDPDRLQLTGPTPGRLEDWTERAELNSPELRSFRAQREAARREIDKARSGHLPTLDAVAQWSVSTSENVTRINSTYDNKAVGLQLNVPIFAGGYVNSQTRAAIADLERVEQSLEATRRDLALRVEKEFRGVTEGVLRVKALEQAVKSADVMVVSNRRSFEAGSRILVDVLNAEQQQASAQRDLAQARYLYMLSRVRLRALAGEADYDAIAEVNGWLSP